MNDKLRYEKVKDKNIKLKHLPNINYSVEEGTDVVVSGLGFIRITKEGSIKIYTLDEKMISKRKSMIQMNKINVMSESLANKIAAGEVV